MNLLPILGGIGQGLLSGYMMGNAPQGLYGGSSQGAMPTDMGGGVQSSVLPGVMPGANVPLDTGSGAQGGMFGGTGQGLTNASAGLFSGGGVGPMAQPSGANAFYGSGLVSPQQQRGMMGMLGQQPGQSGGMNPLALALMMGR